MNHPKKCSIEGCDKKAYLVRIIEDYPHESEYYINVIKTTIIQRYSCREHIEDIIDKNKGCKKIYFGRNLLIYQ